MREPAQVFQLLETIYSEFDRIAKKRRIFKVETVGDCYVAACGIPDPRRDHAVAMARFARDCRASMMSLMTDLEITLGPDTGELGLRVGLHSGPVTVSNIAIARTLPRFNKSSCLIHSLTSNLNHIPFYFS